MAFSIREYIDAQFVNDDKQKINIGGFSMFAFMGAVTTKKTGIPKSVLEDKSVISDNLNNEPVTFTVSGNVSDIFTEPSPALEALSGLQSELGNITQYLPERTRSQLTKINGISADLQSGIDRADFLIDSGHQAGRFLGLVGEAEEKRGWIKTFLDTMEAIRLSKSLTNVTLTHETYPNVGVASIVTTEKPTDKSVDFQIVFEQVNSVVLELVEVTRVPAAPKPTSKTGGDTKGIVDKGVQAGGEVDKSFLSYIFGK